MMAADPADVSVLHMAFYLRSGGGIRYLNAFEGGAQQDRVDGGAHQLAEQLAARLGDRVRLGSRCARSTRTGDGVRGRAPIRRAHPATPWWSRCRRCWPTPIDYRPGLPAPRPARPPRPAAR